MEPPDIPPEEEEAEEGQSPVAPKRARGGGGMMLSAAMLALGDLLEPQKTTVEIEQTADDPIDELPFNIDFGDLPPLG